MSANITALPREHRESFAPNDKLIGQLEKYLEEARAGKLMAAAFALVYTDELVPAGFTGSGWVMAQGCYHAMTHAVAQLERRWGIYCDDPNS